MSASKKRQYESGTKDLNKEDNADQKIHGDGTTTVSKMATNIVM